MHAPNSLRISRDGLADFAERIFVSAGFAMAHAQTIADVLVWAHLRGIESHGVLRIPTYLGFIEKGDMNPGAMPQIAIDLPAAVLIEGDRAAGPVAMVEATKRAVEKAKTAGIGLALVRRTTHTGPIGYYALQAAEAGMAGIVMSSSTPNMAYHGASRAGIANCPLAIAVPSAAAAPLVLDMASSMAAAGKIKHALDTNSPIPEGWALTNEGKSTTDPKKADLLLPLGGAKGSGLALMIECLTGLLTGNPLLEAIVAGREPRRHRQNALVIALNIAAFTEPAAFAGDAAALTSALKALPKASDSQAILVPGERGAATERERLRSGIPLARGTWKKLEELAKARGIALPMMTE